MRIKSGINMRMRTITRIDMKRRRRIAIEAETFAHSCITCMSVTSPSKIPAMTAAPKLTASSGFTVRLGSIPVIIFTSLCTAGILVDPPTRMTSSSAYCSFISIFIFSNIVIFFILIIFIY